MSLAAKRRQPGTGAGRALVARIQALSERYPRFGYRKIYTLLKVEHWRVSRETVRRIRQCEGLQVVKRVRRKRLAGASTATPTRAAYATHVWSYDFVHDETTDGRRLKCLTVSGDMRVERVAIFSTLIARCRTPAVSRAQWLERRRSGSYWASAPVP